MTVAAAVDLPLEIFAGQASDMAPSDVPSGASPACQDVAFVIGAVKTRPGLGNGAIVNLAGNPTVNYLKTFTDLNLNNRMLFLDGLGNLYQEFPQGVVAMLAAATTASVAGGYAKSNTLFGREYLGFHDGKFGLDIPRQFDETNFDRVSQVGPGAAPTVGDEQVTFAIVASAGGLIPQTLDLTIAAIAQVGALVTVTYVAQPTLTQVGDSVIVSGTTNYNGTFAVVSVNPTANQLQFILGATTGLAPEAAGTVGTNLVTVITTVANDFVLGALVTIAGAGVAGFDTVGTPVRGVLTNTEFVVYIAGSEGLGNSGGGAVNRAGVVAPGLHGIAYCFITRQGFISPPSPPVSWTASGNLRAAVTNLLTGPANVIARLLIFTAATGATYFYTVGTNGTADMQLHDNASTALTVDFSDAELTNATEASNLFNQIELGECAGVLGYASRLFWWGERNKLQNFLNLTFDGGFNGNVPAGWNADPNHAAGGTQDAVNAIWGSAYRITGDGATAIRGKITQSAAFDTFGVPRLRPNVAYSVRMRVVKGGGLATGTLQLNLFSASLGAIGAGLSVTAIQATGGYQEFIGTLCPAQAAIPADLVLQLYADGIPTNGGYFVADNIEIFPTSTPYNLSIVRSSYINQPEGYDGVTGFLQVAVNNGQAVRSAFVLREKIYFVKEHGLYVSEDDGQNEPALWSITEISNKVGTPSVEGVDVAEEWAIIANREGAYIFWGPEPTKITQEDQPTWDTINWQYGHRLWVRVDTQNKRILIGAPTGAASYPNKVFYIDYRGLDTAAEIASGGVVKISAYSGKVLAIDKQRKFAPWNMQINAAALIERNDGTAHMFMGNGKGTGKIYDLEESNRSDDGHGIPWSYTTYYAPSHLEEQSLQLRSHRKLFTYLSGFVRGAGLMSISAQPIGNITPDVLPSLALVDPTTTANITAIQRTRGILTVTCAGGHNLAATDTQAVIAGSNDPTMNGCFPLGRALNPNAFTVTQWLLPDSQPGPAGTVARLLRDFEMTINVLGERVSFTFANQGNAPGSWMQMEKLVFILCPDPWAIVRGI